MRYYHRSALPAQPVLVEADRFFGGTLAPVESGARRRTYAGPIGRITISVRPEGGHYTLITAETDQVGEAEVDKLARRFLATVHQRLEPSHALRGAY